MPLILQRRLWDSGMNRQKDPHGSAPASDAFDDESPAMFFDNLMGNGQPQS
jgi:hypothetical protein